MRTENQSTGNLRAISSDDRDVITTLLARHWAGPIVVTRGQVYDASELPGFIVATEDHILGFVTYRIDGDACEIMTLNSFQEKQGVGASLIAAVADAARDAGCKRLWLVTSNDNLPAQSFYAKRGFALVATHENAIEVSRKLKPEIPEFGWSGIPVRDELEFELLLEV